jgi:hypothetical protein
VLQHQYWGLEAHEDWFQATLSFNKIPERLVIPYAAITAFADPSVQFGLQFRVTPNAENRPAMATPSPIGNAEQTGQVEGAADAPASDDAGERKTGDVVALDAFRKKKT